jgi:steroid delta-isomerase-like uncharacterized protein
LGLDAADEMVASDMVIHEPSHDIHGRDGAKQFVVMLRAGFPDIHFTIENQIAEEDRVVTRFTARGTHTGEFRGLPATGKQIRVTGTETDRIADGMCVERWTNIDQLGMMQQLGIIPAPPAAR